MSAPAPVDGPAPLDASGAELQLRVRRGRLAAALLVTGLLLVVVSAVWQGAKGDGWAPFSLLLDRVLDADHDRSILNWLSTSVYLAASLVAALAATRTAASGARWGWGAVAGVLLLVSADEAAGLHDPVKGRVQAVLDDGGARALVVLAVLVVAGLLAAVFLVRQPPAVRWRLTAAAVLLPVAAVGVDVLGPDLIDDPAARLEPGYLLRAGLEELGELVAAVLALDACLLAVLRPTSRRAVPA